MTDFAPGIPSSKKKSTLPSVLKSEDWDFVVHEHEAERAGHHYDLRLSDGNKAFSWAVPKGLPEPGQKRLAIRQPDHRPSYMPFEGKIQSGYGKGDVRIADSGAVKVTHSSGDKFKFVLMNKKDPEEFAMVRTTGENWILLNRTPTRDKLPEEYREKRKYRIATPDTVANYFGSEYALQPKIDGAHAVTELSSKGVRIFSPRESSRSGRAIQYTHQIPGVVDLQVPKNSKTTVLRGEIIGIGPDGKAIPYSKLGGLLNATPENSQRMQKTDGIKLKQMLFDVEKHDGQDMRKVRYKEKLRVLSQIAKKYPDLFAVPETATSPKTKARLFEEIAGGRFAHTMEGVVAHHLEDPSAAPTKIVLRDTKDVYVRGVVPAKAGTKYEDSHAGGFEYSHTPKGPIAGKVGTGFSDQQREDMVKNPKKYVGRAARVVSLGQGATGALRAPAFLDWHLDKGADVTKDKVFSSGWTSTRNAKKHAKKHAPGMGLTPEQYITKAEEFSYNLKKLVKEREEAGTVLYKIPWKPQRLLVQKDTGKVITFYGQGKLLVDKAALQQGFSDTLSLLEHVGRQFNV